MSNMAYVRFQNTLRDLRDCNEHIFDELTPEENEARTQLIEVCHEILDSVEDYEDEEDES